MSEYLVNGEDLTTVADAIRSKANTADSLVFPSGMADAIAGIDTKLPEQEKSATPTTSEVIVTPDSGKTLSKVTVSPIQTETKIITPSTSEQIVVPTTGKFISQATVSAVQTETKSVSPSTSSQIITPTSGKFLSQVTVNAISPTKSAATYIPTTYNQTISSGRWLTGTQTISGDSNLVASNIRSGVSIFGVTGSYEGGSGYQAYAGQVIQTSESTSISLPIGKDLSDSEIHLILILYRCSTEADEEIVAWAFVSKSSALFEYGTGCGHMNAYDANMSWSPSDYYEISGTNLIAGISTRSDDYFAANGEYDYAVVVS